MARFDEDSPDTIPLHTMGKEWVHVFVSEGKVNVQHVVRTQFGNRHGGCYEMAPVKAEQLIKALKRAVKEAKKR